MEKLLLRASEVSEILGVGRSKAYQMMSSGLLPVVRIGKSVRVPVAQLRDWLANQLPDNANNEKGDTQR
jgi:excisionase family DNA binding protein